MTLPKHIRIDVSPDGRATAVCLHCDRMAPINSASITGATPGLFDAAVKAFSDLHRNHTMHVRGCPCAPRPARSTQLLIHPSLARTSRGGVLGD